ncbi:Crp/Fnr family transcriptional regulator [Ginsengibacter hankyongi]|uniref:Crp/Fnr family transcriptional regulator n=1 Tax=Ginsengibacter hankyongi TaxID=2607284 RepID=A0A5J5IJC6_9BACT|nr:Crp/Fnr family transcriptional regulator [Ginsengibacter hankyongi]KAA9041076.1 Crp/Fnr family transcriptional regulator [Ginsengibacter hankyongi]
MINDHEIKNLFPLFERKLLEEIESNAEIIEYEEGEDLIKSGQNIKSTMLIKKGLVKIYREDEDGNEIFMYHLEPGQACALSILCAVQHKTSEIKATAVKPTEVYAIPVHLVEQWMKEYKSWYQFILSTYRSRFEELLNTIDAIAFKNMDERLVMYLKKHSEISNNKTITVTHAQIAAELTTSREVVSRLLKKLAERGLIKVNRQNIEIINLD